MALTKVKINLGTQGNLSGSRSIIQTTKTLVSSSAQLSSEISGSFTTASSSFSTRVSTIEGSGTAQGVGTSDSPTFNNLTATGTVTAQEFHSEFVSASVTFTSGSHKFGNSGDDIQHMTGSLRLSGSITNESYIIGTNVGIGTNNPATKLHIQGSGNTDGIRLANTGYSYYNEIKNNGDGLLIDVDKGDAGGAGADLRINISDTERLRITNDGELGINSNNPDEELEVFGATDVGIKLRALGTTTTAGSHVPTISLQSNQGDGVTARASISADRDGASTKGALIFSSRVSDNITEVMRINGSGNVGIGTNNPGSVLHVRVGSNQNLGFNSSSSVFRLSAFNDAVNANVPLIINASSLRFGISDSEKMRINSSGNVGISETSPTALLHIKRGGSSYTAANLAESAGGAGVFRIQPDGTNQTSLFASSVHNYRVALQVSGSSSGDNGLVLQPFEGNVGIGTSQPSDVLTITDGATPYAADAKRLLQLKRNATNSHDDNSFCGILFGNNSNGFHIGYGGTSDRFRFIDGGAVERMCIENGGNVGIGTNAPTSTSQLHVEASKAEIRIKGTNDSHSDEVSHLIMEASSDRRAGITIEGDSNDVQAFIGRPYDSPNVLAFETDATNRLTIGSDGGIVQARGKYSRFSGNWEILDVVSRSSDASDIQSSNCFADNRYGYFKIVIPYIRGDSGGADLQLTFLYNSGGGLTEDTTYYYGHKQTMGHSSSGYGGAAYDNQSAMTIFTNHWDNVSGGIQGELYIYNVTYHDTSNFDTSIFSAHAYTGNGDRGNYYRPIGRGELMGYNTGGSGYVRDSSFFRNNNDRDPDHWKGFRLKFNTGNVRAQSRFIVLGMPL